MTGAAVLVDALALTLSRVDDLTPGIRSFHLRKKDGGILPSYPAGSHINVVCGTKINAYSLTGDGDSPGEYSISVLRLDDGDGGSSAMHALNCGDTVFVSRPKSAFAPLATARHHLLVAAGIGITPMLTHARSARSWKRSVTLLYSYRPGQAAHLDEVRDILGDDLIENTSREVFDLNIKEQLRNQPVGAHLYICGPAGFTTTVIEQARAAGWPDARVHNELFGAADLDPGEPFTVTLTASKQRVTVPSGVSLLAALEKVGHTIPNMCRQGVCGMCLIPVVSGVAQHRDIFLSDDEKAAGDSILCCVSRSASNEMELNL